MKSTFYVRQDAGEKIIRAMQVGFNFIIIIELAFYLILLNNNLKLPIVRISAWHFVASELE